MMTYYESLKQIKKSNFAAQLSVRAIQKSEKEQLIDWPVVHYHSQASPEDLGFAVVDIFRVKNCRIVEHWDVLQPVPAKSANDNTVF